MTRATYGFVPLHLFMNPNGGFSDVDMAWACLRWADTLYSWGYGR